MLILNFLASKWLVVVVIVIVQLGKNAIYSRCTGLDLASRCDHSGKVLFAVENRSLGYRRHSLLRGRSYSSSRTPPMRDKPIERLHRSYKR